MNEASGLSGQRYQLLGKKTFWLFVSERSALALVIFLVSIFIFLVSGKTPTLNIFSLYAINLRFIALVGLGLFAIVAAAAILISWLTYINYKFIMDADSLKVKRGVFGREEIAIPYRQIQDVTIEQSLSFRIWGLSRLVILTAGHEDIKNEENESEGILPALDKDVAEKLQEELLRRANVQKVTEMK